MAKRKRALPKALRDHDAEALVSAATTERDRLIMDLGRFTGLRVAEICHLRVEDLDFDAAELFVSEGKGSKDRVVPLPSKIAPRLQAWCAGRTDGPVFVSRNHRAMSTRRVQQIVKAAATAAGITQKTTPHRLRHTYATNLLRKGADIREVSELLGHSDIRTTSIYLSVAVDRLRGAVERL